MDYLKIGDPNIPAELWDHVTFKNINVYHLLAGISIAYTLIIIANTYYGSKERKRIEEELKEYLKRKNQ